MDLIPAVPRVAAKHRGRHGREHIHGGRPLTAVCGTAVENALPILVLVVRAVLPRNVESTGVSLDLRLVIVRASLGAGLEDDAVLSTE